MFSDILVNRDILLVPSEFLLAGGIASWITTVQYKFNASCWTRYMKVYTKFSSQTKCPSIKYFFIFFGQGGPSGGGQLIK